MWASRYNGPDNGLDEAVDVASDSMNNIYIAGRSFENNGIFNAMLIKYDENGSEQWINFFRGMGNSADGWASIDLDMNGDIYVAGNTEIWFSGVDHYQIYATAKYNPSGERQWIATYSSPDSGYASASALELDEDGNVYVTGRCWFEDTYDDYLTIKYSQSPSQNLPPQILAFSPSNLDIISLGTNIAFWASATDPDGDSLLWQWRLDSAVVATDSFCTITFNELGQHQVVCTVSDGQLADSVVWDVTVVALSVLDPSSGIPSSFALYPAHPNPFNAATVIRFQLPAAGYVKMEIMDIAGRVVAHAGGGNTPALRWYPAGDHEFPFDGSQLPSGIYICRIGAGGWSAAQKLVLLK